MTKRYAVRKKDTDLFLERYNRDNKIVYTKDLLKAKFYTTKSYCKSSINNLTLGYWIKDEYIYTRKPKAVLEIIEIEVDLTIKEV